MIIPSRDLFRVSPARRGYLKTTSWLNQQYRRESRRAYAEHKYFVEHEEYLYPESAIQSYDEHLRSRIQEASCLVDVRGTEFLERVVSDHLSEILPVPTLGPANMDVVDWSRLNYERIRAELAGEAEVRKQPNDERWVSLSEASRRTGITSSTLKNWIRLGKIPQSVVHNNRIAVSALDDLPKSTRGRPRKHTMIEQLPVDGLTQEQADELLERTVEAIRNWNTPVREFVVTQYVSTKKLRLDKQRTRQLIEYGVQRGKLESWTDQPYSHLPHVVSKTVGLPGMPHVLGTSNVTKRHLGRKFTRQRDVPPKEIEKPAVSRWDIQHRTAHAIDPDVNRQRIQHQYDKLSAETKQEIIALLTDPDPAQRASVVDIQKAYGIMGGTVGMVKREFGLQTRRYPPVKRSEVKLLIPREVKPRPPKTPSAQNTATSAQNFITSHAGNLPLPPTSHAGQFAVTVLQTITLDAKSPEDAFTKAKNLEGVSEVISIQPTS